MEEQLNNRDYYENLTTAELKQECIRKCKDSGQKSSWVQTTSNEKRIQFLLGNDQPTDDSLPTSLPKMQEHNADTSTDTASKPNVQPQAGSMESMIVDAVSDKIKNEVTDEVMTLAVGLEERVQDMISTAEDMVKPITIEVKDKPTITITDEMVHPKFDEVFESLYYKNLVCLVGPAGTGKSTLVKQVWDKLAPSIDMSVNDYQYIGCSAGLSEAQLLGKMDAHGKYHTGLAVDKFENGGINVWDEADAMDSNAGLIRNAMLDGQGYIAVPNRTENPLAWKHDNYFDATIMNTFGDGQDFSYAGRGQQDSATLDRLGDVTIFIDYDKGLEKKLANDDKWSAMLWELRNRMNREHIHERIISTRRFYDANVWNQAGKTPEWFLKRITTSWTAEELDKINFGGLLNEYK